MEEILVRMFLQEQQIKQDHVLKMQADTSLVYEGIFAEFHYDTDDFLHSLSYYLEDAARMEKIMDNVEKRLMADGEAVKKELELERWRDLMLRIYRMQPDTSLRPLPPAPAADTLLVRLLQDSVRAVFPADTMPQPHPDSLLFVRDSL